MKIVNHSVSARSIPRKRKVRGLQCAAVFMLMFCMTSLSSAAESLSETEGWFSIPTVGITTIDAKPDGIAAHYKGTIAYKNKLKFESLEFDFSSQAQGSGDNTVLFQFNKYRRDSSIKDHHLHGFDKHNYGYGLKFKPNGTIALVRTGKMLESMKDGFTGNSSLCLGLSETRLIV